MKFVKNLGPNRLKPQEIIVLAKGLKFIPTPDPPKLKDILQDISLFERRMRLRYKFRNSQRLPHQFRKTSAYIPLATHNNTLETYLALTRAFVHETFLSSRDRRITAKHGKKVRKNCSLGEGLAINHLSANPNLVIRKADKGNTTVVLPIEEYLRIGHEHLTSGNHYTRIPGDITRETVIMVHQVLVDLFGNNEIDADIFNFLDPLQRKDVKIPELYFLPKVHKEPMSGRPIVAGCSSPTQPISKFLDQFLLPIVKKQFTYVRDTSDFIQKVEKIIIPKQALLVCLDITSMYTNVQFPLALKCVREALENNPPINYKMMGFKQPSIESLLALLNVILHRNAFRFNNEFWLQTIGVAMGGAASPEISDIVVHHVEKIILKLEPERIHTWLRFRDDIFCIWLGSGDELNAFVHNANGVYPSFQFKVEWSLQSVHFLDLTVYKGPRFHNQGILDFATYTKPTDTFQYLHRKSCHPEPVFRGFVKGELLRYIRNSSSEKVFAEKKDFFLSKLKERGYDMKLLSTVATEVKFEQRDTLLSNTSKRANTIDKHRPKYPLVFTTRFSPFLEGFGKALRRYWDLIKKDDLLNELFPNQPIIAFCRNKNICDLLCSARISHGEGRCTQPSSRGSMGTPFVGPISPIQATSSNVADSPSSPLSCLVALINSETNVESVKD